jgi:hypothetical protein
MSVPALTVPAFETFLPVIMALPAGRPLGRAELLVDGLRLHRDRQVEVYYIPTDGLSQAAKLMLLGITPGWTQMELAYRHVRQGLHDGLEPGEARRRARYAASFGGPMRTNLVGMLDGIGVNALLEVPSSRVLFDDAHAHLHSTSILRHPVFVAGENFTGHAKIVTHGALASAMVRGIFLGELAALPRALIVPMGDYVSGQLNELVVEGLVDPARVLFGFPHPSGANGHRKSRFEERRGELAGKAQRWFSRARGTPP